MNNPQIYFISTLNNSYMRMSKSHGRKYIPLDYPFHGECIAKTEHDHCIYAFVITEPYKKLFDKTDRMLQGILLHLFELYFTANYFKEIRKPIDFTESEHYYFDTAKLLSKTLNMPLVALRRLTTDNDLESLCFYDAGDESISYLDFLADELPEAFTALIEKTEKIIENNMMENIEPDYHCDVDIEKPEYVFLSHDQRLKDVRTFIIFPIVHGNSLFGIMSFASRCRYVFTEAQKQAICSLMQIIGVSTSNNYYNDTQALQALRTEHIINTTTLEVAKSTKHELSNSQAVASTRFIALKKALEPNHRNKYINELNELGECIDSFIDNIQKLTFGDKAIELIEKKSIRSIWDEVVKLVGTRLTSMAIKTDYRGPVCPGDFYAEMLKNAFVNLILNSIDALKIRRKLEER